MHFSHWSASYQSRLPASRSLPVTVLDPLIPGSFNPIAAVPPEKFSLYIPAPVPASSGTSSPDFVLILRISKELIALTHLSLLQNRLTPPQWLCFADIPAFLPCLAAQDRNQQVPRFLLQSVNPLFFKKKNTAMFFSF